MSKRRDLGQLALMGLASGLMLSTDASADINSQLSTPDDFHTYLAAGGCGGKGGCGGMSGRSVPGKQNGYYKSYRKSNGEQQVKRQSAQSSVSERTLLSHLSRKEQAIYEKLSPEAKQLVLKVAAQDFPSR